MRSAAGLQLGIFSFRTRRTSRDGESASSPGAFLKGFLLTLSAPLWMKAVVPRANEKSRASESGLSRSV